MRRVVAVLLVALAAAPFAGAAVRNPTPSADEFGRDFVATANAYARQHGRAERLTRPDCVQAAPRKYMCSYEVARPGRALDCHLMQATWMPEGASTIHVTLSGRVARCETLRAALDSL